jgi:hypothetical protein
MKTIVIQFRRRLAASMIAFASVLALHTVKFEQDPQSCGMITVEFKKKKQHRIELH